MGNSILGIGISGLNSAQSNLLTAGHNITNVDTPGYNRQKVIQSANTPQSTSGGYIGSGVHVSTIQRVYNQFLVSQSLQAQTKSSQLDSYFSEIAQINNLLGDSSAGLSPALQSFFSSVQDVATNPASVPSRQALLSNSQALVTRLQVMDQRLSESREGINAQIETGIGEINAIAQQIAELNYNITLSEAQAGGHPANDLLDQREALTTQLGKLVNTSVIRQNDGTFNVFIGTGQPLVVGSQTMTLKAVSSPEDPAKITVGFTSGNNTVLIPEKQLQDGGSLGGLLAFRSKTLDSAQNALGRLAIGLAQNFNDQHNLGQDLNGNLGGNFFTVPSPKVISVLGNNPASNITTSMSDINALTTSDYKFTFDGTNYTLTRLSDNTSNSTVALPSGATPLTLDGIRISGAVINANESFIIQPTRNGAKNIAVAITETAKIAAAAPIRTTEALTNTGSGTISAGSVNPLPVDPDLQQLVTITFHSPLDGQFDVTGGGAGLPALNQVFTQGADISFHGFTVQINGNPAAGDIFTIGPNNNGNSDNRNALLLGGLQTKNLLIGSTATFQSTYAQLVSEIGNKTRELEVTSKAQKNLLAQTNQSLQSLSGVNLDEEAANLLRYQQAYQASSKIIEISSKLFDSLINMR
ncbi:MAG: flagellar hook-associated protein FlgK [Nitrosomonas sp.]|nr:flagellar hook-associated protein FlgK [Nitrosomonas sp.]MDP1950152.1 flagellar hook-associated protein FlgK [Nitrosomonas sp.]